MPKPILVDAARKLHYLRYVSRDVAGVIETHRAGLATLARLRDDSEARTAELAAIEARGRAERERLLQERRERQRQLDRSAGEIRSAKKRIQVMVADEARLSRLAEEIAKLIAARPGAGFERPGRVVASVPEATAGREPPGGVEGSFPARRGQLRMPVRGELAGGFGGQRSAGSASAKGVFIRAAEGEPVRAVAPGRVVYADWMRVRATWTPPSAAAWTTSCTGWCGTSRARRRACLKAWRKDRCDPTAAARSA